MDTTVEALQDNQKKLTVTIDAADVDKRIKRQYRDFANRYNFPGFRRGKAPRPVIDNMLGREAVVAAVTDDVVNSLYPVAMDENDLIAIGQPTFEDQEAMVEEGKPFSFAVTVETRPEFELSSYDQVEIKLPSSEATEEEINEQIDEMRNYLYSFEDAADDAAIEEKGYAEIALTATDAEGAHVESLESESRLYELGSELFPASFDKELVGLKKGDKKSFQVDMSEPSLMGQGLDDAGTITFDVEVKQVKNKVLPELTDEWAKETAGFKDLQDLRDHVADSVKQQKEQMMPRLRENETLYALQERLQGEAPQGMCDEEEQNLLQNFFMQIQQAQMTFDAYLAQMGISSQQFREDLKKQAKDVSEQDLALDAWARHAGIQVTDEEITAEFEKTGVEDPAGLEKQWREQGRIASLRAGMKRTKALDAIIADLKVEDLKPGEKLNSAKAEEEEDAAAGTSDAAAAPAEEKAEEPAAEAAEDARPNKTALNKMKVAELREMAQGMGLEVEGLKKAEIVDAILAAE